MTISPIRAIERAQAHVGDRVDHEPRQMIGWQPIPHVRRQKKPLLTPTLDEVLRHTLILLTAPDRTLCATASRQGSSLGETAPLIEIHQSRRRCCT